MNSFHQTKRSSTTLEKFFGEKYHWEGTGELAGLLSASVKQKTCFCVCAELQSFFLEVFLPGRTWSVERLSTTTDVFLLKMMLVMLEKLSKTYIRIEEFTTHKGPTQG